MPLPIAHGLLGSSMVAAGSQPSESRQWRLLLLGAFLGICPDFDYALNWLGISGGGWHHGFTHSILFALLLGLITAVVLGKWELRSVVLFSAATVSHTFLDFLMTESRGVALWWPFTNHRYRFSLPSPIYYSWRTSSIWEGIVDMLRISLCELLIFAPILVLVLLARKFFDRRSVTARGAA